MSQPAEARTAWPLAPAARYEHFPTLPLEEDYLERLRFDADRHSVVLGLGGFPVEVRTDSAELNDYLCEVYGSFAEASEPIVRLAIGGVAAGRLPFEPQLGALAMYNRGSHVVGKFRDMAGYVDTGRREGRAILAGQNFRQDLSNYLRLVLDALAPTLDAVLFHTAAVARSGETYVFYGESNAGKSTISALAAHRHEVMTDDMLIPRHVDGQLRAATCGFWGGETRGYASKRCELPVRALYRLKKGERNRLTPLGSMRSVLDVICGVPNMTRPPRHHQRILAFASATASMVPFYELEFQKNDDSFWSVIDDGK